MTEQEVKPFIIRLYAEFLTGYDAEARDAFDEDAVTEGAESLANQFILDVKNAGEMDSLLSLSPEEIMGLLNVADSSK